MPVIASRAGCALTAVTRRRVVRRETTDRAKDVCTGAPFRRVLAPKEGDGPAPGILARGLTTAAPSLPERSLSGLASDVSSDPQSGNSALRLQWRHRVGFAPTSRGRRAEPGRVSGSEW